jgi:hypothetical protein
VKTTTNSCKLSTNSKEITHPDNDGKSDRIKCHNCGRRNHFQKCCPSAQDSSTEEESSASEQKDQTKKKNSDKKKKKSSAKPKTHGIQTDIIDMEEEFVDLHIH